MKGLSLAVLLSLLIAGCSKQLSDHDADDILQEDPSSELPNCPSGSKCDDGDPCTVNDECQDDNACRGTLVALCDDQLECTEDSCESESKCSHELMDGYCLVNGKCFEDGVPHPNSICKSCQPLEDKYAFSAGLDDVPCSDDNACTTGDKCLSGMCVGGPPPNCNDQNFCTADACDTTKGCVNLPEHQNEDCQTPQGQDGLCLAGVCSPECAEDNHCDDLQECTTDTCNQALGHCEFKPDDALCDDSSLCTKDHCEPGFGCIYTAENESAICKTLSEQDGVCIQGVCTPECTEDKDCNDGVACTDDSCNKVLGKCMAVPNNNLCDDKDICNGLETCEQLSGCKSGQNLVCDDGNVCNGLETCDSTEGCLDGPPLNCDDGNPCTSPECDAFSGCLFTPVVSSCPSDHPPCEGTCVGTECLFDVEYLNGLDDDCDGYLDEDFDLDHDSVCDSPDCSVQALDTCPTVWNPDNDPELCPPVVPGTWKSRQITLKQPDKPEGTSTWRRTNEPVEIPLWNGILDDSLIGYWKLDGNGLDSIGQLHGIEHDLVPSIGAFGEDEGAVTFNGQSSRIVVLDTDLLEVGENDFSISAWLRPQGFDTYTYPVSKYKRGDFGAGWNITVTTDGSVLFVVRDGGEFAYNAKSTSKLAASNWYHIVGVKVGEFIQLWINGSLEKAVLVGSGSLDNPDHFTLGKHTKNAEYFAGKIDEVVYMRRALQPTEITTYYHSKRPYGTDLVPGSQADFDDIRIVESSPHHVKEIVPSEVIGIRPHSDTPCPMADDDGSWADRDDLCGVVGYWKLDGDGTDSSGQGNDAQSNYTPKYEPGRFGKQSGAPLLPASAESPSPSFTALDSPSLNINTFTLESWIRVSDISSVSMIVKGLYGPESVNYHLYLNVDGRPYCGFNGSSGPHTCGTDGAITINRWTHLACTFDGQNLNLFVDGLSATSCSAQDTPSNSNWTMAIGGTYAATADHWLDEVLVHSVAKSPDYIYRRANPGVPTVRFLAHTEPYKNPSSTYDFLEYELQWEEDNVTHVAPILTGLDKVSKCYGFLSPCLGYAGWWRFNEGGGLIAVDASTNRNHGDLSGEVTRGQGLEGLSVRFGGTDDHIIVPHDESLSLTEFTIETGFTLDSITNGQSRTLLHKGYSEDPDLSNYALVINNAGKALGQYENSQGTNVGVVGSAVVPVDYWHRTVLAKNAVSLWLYDGDSSPEVVSNGSNPAVNSDELTIGVNRYADVETWHSSLFGAIDSIRIMSRALAPDEFLHIPLADWELEPCSGDDSDCDGDPDATDCAPLAPGVSNNAVETCNSIDDDCDGTTDEEAICSTPLFCSGEGQCEVDWVQSCQYMVESICSNMMAPCDFLGLIPSEWMDECLKFITSEKVDISDGCQELVDSPSSNPDVDTIKASGAEYLHHCIDDYECTLGNIGKLGDFIQPIIQGEEFDPSDTLPLIIDLCFP